MKELRNKVAVITGAGSGIGRALAVAFADEGCHLALTDISEKGLQETVNALAGKNVKITTHIANVADRERMRALPEEIEREHGAIHLLFNNAGVTINKSFEDSTLEDLDFVINIDMWGVVYGCKFFLPYLKKQAESHIVNTSSLAGFLGLPNQSTYCLSKAAVKSLSESLRAELAIYNIGVTSIHPGTIRTNILRNAVDKSGQNSEKTAKLASMMERFGMPPEKLAKKVVRAVKDNRMQVRIGFDSYLGDWLKRLLPIAVHAPLRWGFKRSVQQA
ncbi:MAG TPA: SDR family NAD(P)-dependent oxidoreductase, partial [Pseudomonadales bacterium]|nr:SDR family NAD(P)-dependent oxidoreductase [Pseudomonadales bacterium]